MQLLFIDDIMGQRVLARQFSTVLVRNPVDPVVTNAENAAGDAGTTRASAEELFAFGIDTRKSLRRFVHKLSGRVDPAAGPASLCAVLLDIDTRHGLARSIQRVRCEETLTVPENRLRVVN